VEQPVPVEQVRHGRVIEVARPALRGVFHGQIGTRYLAEPVHHLDDPRQIGAARTVVGMPGLRDRLKRKQVPPGSLRVPEQTRCDRRDYQVDHRLSPLPDDAVITVPDAFQEHTSAVGVQQQREMRLFPLSRGAGVAYLPCPFLDGAAHWLL
jgi:hypothetical protein